MREHIQVKANRPVLSRNKPRRVDTSKPVKPVWSHQSHLSSAIGRGIIVNVANQDYETSGVLKAVDNFSLLIEDLNGKELVIFKSAIESFHFHTGLGK